MRITESQLRRVIRRIISEAPLAGLDPPAQGIKPQYSGASKDQDQARKIFSSSYFQNRLERLLLNFPLDVWVSPVVGSYYAEAQNFDRPGDRAFLVEPQEAIERGSDYLANAARAWVDRTGGRGALVVPMSSAASRAAEITPWMIFHSIVDGRGDVWQNEGPNEDVFMPEFLRMMDPLTRATELVSDTIEAIGVCFGREAQGRDESGYQLPLYFEMQLAKRIERIFTFGSARSAYVTKRAERGGESFAALDELANEAVTQAMMTTAGFKYDKAALESLRADADPDLWERQGIEQKLDSLVALSPELKKSLADSLRGKVTVIAVRAGE